MTWQTVISTVKSGTECPINRCNMPRNPFFSGSVAGSSALCANQIQRNQALESLLLVVGVADVVVEEDVGRDPNLCTVS
jgi:hypothetical protein